VGRIQSGLEAERDALKEKVAALAARVQTAEGAVAGAAAEAEAAAAAAAEARAHADAEVERAAAAAETTARASALADARARRLAEVERAREEAATAAQAAQAEAAEGRERIVELEAEVTAGAEKFGLKLSACKEERDAALAESRRLMYVRVAYSLATLVPRCAISSERRSYGRYAYRVQPVECGFSNAAWSAAGGWSGLTRGGSEEPLQALSLERERVRDYCMAEWTHTG